MAYESTNSSISLVDVSIMSDPPTKCEVCQFNLDIKHLCIPLEEFKSMAVTDSNKDNEASKESNNNEFVFFNVPAINSSEDEVPIVYADEGSLEDSPAELSLIADLEESVGYHTRALETPPRQPQAPRRRSSTPVRRRSLTFDEFIQNLMDDEQVLPGLEDVHRPHDMSPLSIDGSAEFMEF